MKKVKLYNSAPRRMLIVLSTLVLAVVGAYLLTRGKAASLATLSLNPASSQVGLGSNIVVNIVENSSTVPVNAVQANLTYDQTKLQYVSTDITTSPFTTVVENTGGAGSVKLGLAILSTSVTGPQTVAKVTFKAIATGAAPISFAAGSDIIQASNNLSMAPTNTGVTYTIADTTAPTAPSNITTVKNTTSIALGWTASTDNVAVTGYKIYRNGTQVGTSTTTAYTDNGLAPLTVYNYAVAAYDAAGNTSTQATLSNVQTTADTSIPTTPTNVTVGNRTITSIILNWSASTDNVAVTGYKIYRNGIQVGTSATTTYTDTGLTASTTYSYTIAANDAANNNSGFSIAISASTLTDTVAPTVPGAPTSPSQTTNSITLNWTASTDNVAVTGYLIYRNGIQVGTSTTTSYTDNGLTTGSSYTYTIAARDAIGNTSTQSTTIILTTIVKPGDINGDGYINILDLSTLAANYGQNGRIRSQGDLDGNGSVNILDLSILASNWGK